MKRVVMVAALTSVLAMPAISIAATRPTPGQAWESANACLMAHGARMATHRVGGGGFVYLRFFNANLYEAYWTYILKSNGRVKSAHVHFHRGVPL